MRDAHSPDQPCKSLGFVANLRIQSVISVSAPLPADRAGETADSLDDLAERYWDRAHRFAAMVVRNDQDSADVAQEALLRVFGSLAQFDPQRGSFDVWLWRIVINVAREAGRASVRRSWLRDRLGGDREAGQAGDAETIAIQRMADAELLAAVRKLKPRPRTVIALRFGAQLSYAEMAAQLRISEAAALMATRRALETLRSRLEESR
jgi:RNA polymerase sigma-70 factor (ECF subfamily)